MDAANEMHPQLVGMGSVSYGAQHKVAVPLPMYNCRTRCPHLVSMCKAPAAAQRQCLQGQAGLPAVGQAQRINQQPQPQLVGV